MARQNEEETGRGRDSSRPNEIPRPGWRDILLRTKNEAMQDDVGLVVAGMAFYALLAVFPAIAALISIYGLVAEPAQVQQQFEAISAFVPEGARDILADQMTKVSQGGSGALGLAAGFSLLLALWSASRGTKAFMTAMNVAYGEEEKRGFILLNATALALTLFLILLAVLAIGCVVVAPVLLAFIAPGALLDWAVTVLRWPLIGVVLVVGLAVLYRFAPSRRQPKWRWVTPGSGVAVLLWLVASVAFSVYVRNFGNYNETYGSLGAVVAMMMWLWLSAFIVVLGAELNAEIERQTERDSTVGRERPLGERGAYAADTVGEKP